MNLTFQEFKKFNQHRNVLYIIYLNIEIYLKLIRRYLDQETVITVGKKGQEATSFNRVA